MTWKQPDNAGDDDWHIGKGTPEPEPAESDLFGSGSPGNCLPPAFHSKPSPNGYQKCPKCREFAAYQTDELYLTCKVCKERFVLMDFQKLIDRPGVHQGDSPDKDA